MDMPYYDVKFLLNRNCAKIIAPIKSPINRIAFASKPLNSPKGVKFIISLNITHVPLVEGVIISVINPTCPIPVPEKGAVLLYETFDICVALVKYYNPA